MKAGIVAAAKENIKATCGAENTTTE